MRSKYRWMLSEFLLIFDVYLLLVFFLDSDFRSLLRSLNSYSSEQKKCSPQEVDFGALSVHVRFDIWNLMASMSYQYMKYN